MSAKILDPACPQCGEARQRSPKRQRWWCPACDARRKKATRSPVDKRRRDKPPCTNCGRQKQRFGPRWRCRPCERDYDRDRFAKDRENQLRRGRVYRRANSKRLTEMHREWVHANKEHMRKYWWHTKLKAFGLTEADYLARLAEQGGVCAICKGPPVGRGKESGLFCIDHDHATNAFRGLLCSKCNTGIGQFNDDERRLSAAIDYLVRARRSLAVSR